MRNFTANLLAYAIGRRVEHFDQPEIRTIAREGEANDYRLSSFILGVVTSAPFRMSEYQTAQPPLAAQAKTEQEN